MTDAAKLEQVQSVPPPPYDGDSALSTVTSRSQQQHPCSTYVRKYDLPTSINPMTHSAAEPVITPIVPQTTIVPYAYQSMSDRPVNVVVNTNGGAEDNRASGDHRICFTCRRGIIEKKKDWLKIIGILLASLLCPPISLLCCFLLCTHVVYFHECSACHQISKRGHK